MSIAAGLTLTNIDWLVKDARESSNCVAKMNKIKFIYILRSIR